MASLAIHAPFVNKQAKRLQEILERHKDDRQARFAYPPLIERFLAISADLVAGQQEIDNLTAENARLTESIAALERQLDLYRSAVDDLEIKPSDLKGLPPELMEQLGFGESELQEFRLLEIIESLGGTVSLSKLLIELFKRDGEVHDRAKLNSRLYRMTQKGMLHSVPDQRGTYSIFRPEVATKLKGEASP